MTKINKGYLVLAATEPDTFKAQAGYALDLADLMNMDLLIILFSWKTQLENNLVQQLHSKADERNIELSIEEIDGQIAESLGGILYRNRRLDMVLTGPVNKPRKERQKMIRILRKLQKPLVCMLNTQSKRVIKYILGYLT